MNASLEDAVRGFVDRYHADAKLCAEQADWNCLMRLQASDVAQHVGIDVRQGRVEGISPRAEAADLVVTASLQVLLDILQLRLNPGQPYLFGELTLTGEEADFMRVDYVASMLCAHA